MEKFDFATNPNTRVIDYDWNHRFIADVRPLNCDIACIEILDPNKTLDEQLAAQAMFTKISADSQPKLEGELAEAVEVREVYYPGLKEDDPEVRCLIISPKAPSRRKRSCILECFGGGMIMGSPETQINEAALLATQLNCVVVFPEYRLLPKWTYPAAVDDMEASVNWVLANADELNINPARMVVYGQSAGGYLAACISQRLKMRGGYQFAGEMLLYPVIDDTFAFDSSDLFYGEIWHPSDDQRVFNALMGTDYYRGAIPADAIPIHCKDFAGLPPTIIWTGDVDYGHDPCIAYARGVMNAGIYCELKVWGGCYHGFVGMAFGTDLYPRAWNQVIECLGDLLSGECVRS